MVVLSWIAGIVFVIGLVVAGYAGAAPRDVSGETSLDNAIGWWIGVIIMGIGILLWLIRFAVWFFGGK